MSQKLNYLSLFSGMGGLDYGLDIAGFNNIGCVEYDKDACSILRKNTSWEIYEQDIRNVDFSLILKNAGIKRAQLDLIVGGPPCQSYSKSSFWTSNTKRGYADSRGRLIDHYMRSVEEILPKAFLIENVPGFCYSSQFGGMKSIQKSLDKIKKKTGFQYSVSFKVLNCVEYGVPQKRERFFLVANRVGVDFKFPLPTHGTMNESISNRKLKPYTTTANAFAGINYKLLDESVAAGGKWKDLLPCVPPGLNYQYFTEKGDGEKLFKYRSKFWTFLLKLTPKEPSWTIQASPGSSTGPFHWDNRKLYSRELARIQTIPDHVELTSNPRLNHKLIGNAVPSLMGEIIGKELRAQLFSQKIRKSYQLLPNENALVARPRYKQIIPEPYL